MKHYVERSVGVITTINPHIGYETAAKIVREAIIENKSILELCKQYEILSEDELNIILDSYEMINLAFLEDC